MRGVAHVWFAGVAAFPLSMFFGGLIKDPSHEWSGLVVALGMTSFFLAFVYGSWLVTLKDIDRRTGHVDPVTRRRGERAELAMLLAFGAVFATAGIVVTVLWFLGKS